MVSYGHELGQRGVLKDGVVWKANVGNVEVDELGAVVLELSEGDREANLPYQSGGAISDS